MVNMDKLTRTKLAMLVTLVLLNLFTTIALYYTMTVSSALNVESGGDPNLLNVAMVLAIVIAGLWVIALIMFHEFKTDDVLRTHIHRLDEKIAELEGFRDSYKLTHATPPMDPALLTYGGVTGHAELPK